MIQETNPGPYTGYEQTGLPDEDAELTHVMPGSPGGEYLRRFWHPVALESEVTDIALPLRILGEDLVLFRALDGSYGLLHRRCAHRGASLEYGRCEQRGLRCCYHGWLFAADGELLEAPGEPPDTPLLRNVRQDAYAVEVKPASCSPTSVHPHTARRSRSTTPSMDGKTTRYFGRPSFTRWVVPVDDTGQACERILKRHGHFATGLRKVEAGVVP